MTTRAAKFQGLGLIILQPHDEDVEYTFTFDIESAAGANDGAIPFGQTLAATPNGCAATIQSHPEDVDYSTEIIGVVSNTGTIVTVPVSYPYTTQMKVAGVVTDTVLDVDDVTGVLVGDKIGVRLDTDAIHWSTVGSIDMTLHTITIDDQLPSGVAIDNNVYIPRMVRGIYHLRLVCTFSGGADKEFDFNRVLVGDR